MIKLLIKKFIKNYQNVNDKDVRESYGILAGVLGVFCNIFLFAIKLTIGLAINSIAVITDAFNNLTDLGSTSVSILGVKLSNRPPDRGHPYGHGRFEYIASLVVSFIIFGFGWQLLLSSYNKIINPEAVVFSPISIIILTLSISVKLWMFSYNRYIGKEIHSSICRATAYDSFSDMITTSSVIISMILDPFINFPFDGIVGVGISCFILYEGFSIAKDMINLLVGSSPEAEVVEKIESMIPHGKYILGTHDLKVHDYGPGRSIATIHVEVPDQSSIVEVHSVIDDLEEKIATELGIHMVIHMDPVSTNVERIRQISASIGSIIKTENPDFSIQNLRVTEGHHRINVIFDLFVPSSIESSQYDKLSMTLIEKICKENSKYNTIISSINKITQTNV